MARASHACAIEVCGVLVQWWMMSVEAAKAVGGEGLACGWIRDMKSSKYNFQVADKIGKKKKTKEK
jgi:hypothetical protein